MLEYDRQLSNSSFITVVLKFPHNEYLDQFRLFDLRYICNKLETCKMMYNFYNHKKTLIDCCVEKNTNEEKHSIVVLTAGIFCQKHRIVPHLCIRVNGFATKECMDTHFLHFILSTGS